MDLSTTHSNTNDIINYNDTTLLLEDIFRFKADREFNGDILNLIVSYCEEYEYRLDEVGDILSNSKEFKEMFEKSLIRGNHFKTEKTDNDEIKIEDDEW